MPRVLEWQISTVVKVRLETLNVKTFTLALPNWIAHRAGQHYDVRLTAPDGYQTQRSYSIASSPEQIGEIELTVERLEEGEVSTYLHDVLIPGDQVELRGPIGGYFVWEASMGGPLLLVAGGSGIVPLMAMIRHRNATGSNVPARLLYSSRTIEDIIYREELEKLDKERSGLDIFHTLTREQPPGWEGFRRRIDLQMLQEVVKPFGSNLKAYICGPTALVEGVANGLVTLGIPASQIRTERFGPTGGS
ncbi:MAG: oxidoreductase [Chloroflexi bacterium RBG_19FT_COMBO_50_10]|nr:MAG: oxidoreductase [Chloroflexi bacterium RBG_19FT_COMBO_50_10]